MKRLIIGTRGSDLALWQANYIKDRLSSIGVEAELKIIKTQGDKILNLRLDKLEGKGFFTKELEDELLTGKIRETQSNVEFLMQVQQTTLGTKDN